MPAVTAPPSRGNTRVFVVGVGMTKFEKPGKRDWDYPQMAKEAIEKALLDAGVPFGAIEQACAGYVYGDSTCAQRSLYEVGISGIPVYNVNNNCSTGSTALFMAKQFVESGLNECVLAFGFEKMEKGSLKAKWDDRTNPLDKHIGVMSETFGITSAPFACQMFSNAGREHMQKYGTKAEHFAKIAVKNHKHSVNNPLSQFRDEYTLDQVMKSPVVHEPMTKLQCCPTSEGAAAAVVVSEAFVIKYGLQKKAIEIAGMSMATDLPSSFTENSMIKAVGFDMTKKAAEEALAQAKMTVNDVQVVELHDCFSANELLTYEALGLCPLGKAGEFIDKGDNTYGGKFVVNPSGGLISKGHPLGATGLAQCAELTWQLRGEADKRQVKGATAALQHNLGLGGAAVVTVYRKPKWDQVGAVAVAVSKKSETFKSAPKLSDFDGSAAEAKAPEKAEKPPAKASGGESGGLKAAAVFKELSGRVSEEMVKKVKASFRFDIQQDSDTSKVKSWLLDLKTGNGSLKDATDSDKADCTVIIKDSDFVALMSGKLNAQQAFLKGQFKIKGNMMLAQKLQLLKATPAKM